MGKSVRVEDVGDHWPSAVSDGLTLPCTDCDRVPLVDYTVDDDHWRDYTTQGEDRLSVICVECFIRRAGDPTKIEEIQIVGRGVTALFHPGRGYRWGAQ